MPKKKKLDTEDAIDEMLEAFPSNSKASKVAPIREERVERLLEEGAFVEKEEPKKITRALRRKKTLAQSIAKSIFGNVAKGMLQQAFYEVLIPAAKDVFQEVVQSGVDVLLYGEARSGHRRDRDKGKTIISYGNFYKGRDHDPKRYDPRNRRDPFGLEDIYFATPKEANDILSELCDQLEEYEWVTVAEYLELAGIDDIPWTAKKWGWNDLKHAKCVHVRGGYAVVLPEEEELD